PLLADDDDDPPVREDGLQPVGDLLRVVAARERLSGEPAPADYGLEPSLLRLREVRLELASGRLGVPLERMRAHEAADRGGVLVDPVVPAGPVEEEPAAQPLRAGLVVADVDQRRRHARASTVASGDRG